MNKQTETEKATYVDDAYKRPVRFHDGLVVLLVILNPRPVILHRFLRVYVFVLHKWDLISTSNRRVNEIERTSGDDIFTLRIFDSTISSLVHEDSATIFGQQGPQKALV